MASALLMTEFYDHKGAVDEAAGTAFVVLARNFVVLIAICFRVLFGKKKVSGVVALQRQKGYGRLYPVLLAVLFTWSMISMTGVSEYLYFSF